MRQLARRIVLAERPVGEPTADTFRMETIELPQPGPGQVLLRTKWLSLDPYMRNRMNDVASYAEPLAIGDVIVAGTVSEVLISNNDKFAPGDIVLGQSGWQDMALSDSNLERIDETIAPIQTALGVLGMPGMTAYSGLLEIGKPAPGETVVVAAASGAVGSVVGQLAKIKGARAVGIAGGPEKCRFVVEELGFDACIDHRSPNFAAALEAATPAGVDVYFENVGGPIFEAVFHRLNWFSRIPICGQIALSNTKSLAPSSISMAQLMRAILVKRLNIRGFIVADFAALQPQFQREMAGWIRSGEVKYREDVVCGLENAPRAFIGLMRGENFGKLLVRI